MRSSFDYAIIGAGSGGLTVAVGLTKLKKNVIVISENIGGECTHSGCVPSKTLLHLTNNLANFSLEDKNNFSKIIQNKIDEIQKEELSLIDNLNINFVKGRAKFLSSNKLLIKTQTGEEYKISFKKCVIATGSSPKKLDDLNISQEKILTNENIFKLEKIPNKITFIGGGPISCELAFAFAKLGSKVKIISTNAILPRENKELTKPIRNNFQKYNVEIIENANTKLELLKDDADYYVLAVGREPNTNLDLEKAKIKYSNLGIEIDNNLQTSNANVYALGDCTTSPKFTHLANNQGRFLIKKFLLPFTSKPNAALPAVTFTDPPIAQVGEIQESELVKKFAIDFNKSDRGMIDDTTENFGNIYVNMLTGKIVGSLPNLF